jgi:hypothetical protein
MKYIHFFLIYQQPPFLPGITLVFLFLNERVAVRPNLTERFSGTEAADQGHDLGQQAVPTDD